MTMMDDGAAPRGEARPHDIRVRVSYGDTDKAGVVYYANYFRFFEQGRGELLRALGVAYRDLELEHGIVMPVVEAGCRYLGPCRYDDLLVVRSWIDSIEAARLSVRNDVFVDGPAGQTKVAEGFTRHAVLNALWRPTRLPEAVRLKLAAAS